MEDIQIFKERLEELVNIYPDNNSFKDISSGIIFSLVRYAPICFFKQFKFLKIYLIV